MKFTNFPTITYLYNTNEGHKAIAEYLQSALAAIGITMNLENQEWNTFLNTRKSGNFSVFQADLACLLDYENVFWAGLSYRWGDAVNFLAGVNFAKIMQVGVAYDLTTSKLGFGNGRSYGSVEFYVNAAFQITIPKRPPTVSGNTLYLR